MKKLVFRTSLMVLVSAVCFAVVTARELNDAPDRLLTASGPLLKAAYFDRLRKPLSFTYQNNLNYSDYAKLHEIPPKLLRAFLISEDKRFFEHTGIDWRARAAALYQNVVNLRQVRGASTITEQVVRILRPRSRGLWARWIEGWEAKLIEEKFSKAEILEFYLNQVPFSAQRRGVVQAARYYFDRDLGTLNLKEQLALAALVRAPTKFDPYKGESLLNVRIKALCSAIQRAEPDEAALCSEIEGLKLDLRRPSEPIEASHFLKFISSRSMAPSGMPENRVVTSLDGALQQKVQKVLDGYIRANATHNIRDGAVLVLDHQSNEILAWVNSGRADPGVPGSFIDAVVTPRQPGSALKPFLYALALERGWNPATILEDAPLLQAVGSGAHSYRNYSRIFYGPVRLRDALGNSLNTPAVRTVGYVGVSDFLEFLHKLGFENLDKSWEFYGEGLALGNGEVSLLELVNAYAVLARGGVKIEPEFTHQENIGSRFPQSRLFSSRTSSLIADILSDPNARRLEFGRGGLLGFSHQIAVKTGTSSDFRDLWAFGFSDKFTVGVWMGNLNRESINNTTSSSGPGLILRSVFHQLEKVHEPRALSRDKSLLHTRICSVSGELASENCSAMDELFDPDQIPKHKCKMHSGEAATPPEITSVNSLIPQIAFPTPGLQVARDPRIPDHLEALRFTLSSKTQFQDVRWLLDGTEVGLGEGNDAKFVWTIEKGRHSLVARAAASEGAPYFQSAPVNFIVK